jgi:hypothetical protein
MMQDVKKAYAWQEAIELSGELLQVCEEFSSNDNVVLGHLRQAVIDIPATIATDIKFRRMATMEPVIRLATELELVHKIYPAIDTGEVPEKLAALMERMSTDRFNEREPEPEDESAGQPEAATESPETEPEAPAAGTTAASKEEPVQPTGGTMVGPQVDQISAPVSRVVPITGDNGLRIETAPAQSSPSQEG